MFVVTKSSNSNLPSEVFKYTLYPKVPSGKPSVSISYATSVFKVGTAIPAKTALSIILEESGKHFDPILAPLFVKTMIDNC